MLRNRIPDRAQAQLDQFEQTAAHLAEQVAQTEAAIASARERLTGGFAKDTEYEDMRKVLDRLVSEDKPKFGYKLAVTTSKLSECKHWLVTLPDNVELETVAVAKPNGANLDHVRNQIEIAEDEIRRLRDVPTPSADAEARVRKYVAALARPSVSGLGKGETLRVVWPNDPAALLALLLPKEMTIALLTEIERESNAPMPLADRQQRIAQLTADIDALRWTARALGDLSLPPQYLLGVKIVEKQARPGRGALEA